MFKNSKPQRRIALTTPETIGAVACLGAGLLAGFWMFGENLTQIIRSNPVASHSNPEDLEGDSNADLNQHVQPKRLEMAPTPSTLPPVASVVAVDKASVAALLGPVSQTAEQPRSNSASRHTTSKARTQHPVSAQSDSAVNSNSIGQKTLAYWNAMNLIMANEEAMRAAPAGGVNQSNAGTFINGRGQAGNYAVEAFRNLDSNNVDPAVVQLGHDIASWYEDGAKLNDTASYLLNRAGANTRRGQTGKKWADAEKAHNASVQAINRRGDQLRTQLSKKYGLAFPDLR